MCGIFSLIRPSIYVKDAMNAFEKGKHRGPDESVFHTLKNVWLGFHRLSINGISNGSQPFCKNGIYLICNGEIYNHQELYSLLDKKPLSQSDCEIIIDLYETFGMEQTLHMINASEFSFFLYDSHKSVYYAARDPYGVRPLFQGFYMNMVCIASELKMFPSCFKNIEPVLPSTFVCYHDNCSKEVHSYKTLPSIQHSFTDPYLRIRETLYQCVKQRVMNTERPMACLLSGGLDSSLIATLVNNCRKELGIQEPLETYSIGLEGGEDLKYAAIMAEFLGSKHTSIVVTEQDFLNSIPEVIYAIESHDTTTVRASVGNYLVAKYIKEHSEAKVIFNGDGSDEVCGGYLYMKRAPNAIEFDNECRRLVKDIHKFDALRSDRCISFHGLEARTPFLDRAFVELYLSIPVHLRYTTCEKETLRKAFDGYMPEIILWRKKEAFSDGVSSLQRSWFSIIQESIPNEIKDNYIESTITLEQYYYQCLYRSFYNVDLLDYYWMPKYTNSKDCSARNLENYSTN
jgi:asparagine synthase (glutamine-hydrolysing)